MPENPPFASTLEPIFKNIITESDPNSFVSIRSNGEGERDVWDRRVNGSRRILFLLYIAAYDDGANVEVRLEKETFHAEADAYSRHYSIPFGRLPRCIRQGVKALSIMGGSVPWGGGTDDIEIHNGYAYENLGLLEEALVHEACHTSLPDLGLAPGWQAAQRDDPTFISNYARDNPQREDIAESFLAYIGLRYRPDRLTQDVRDKITTAISKRIGFFDSIPWSSMLPLKLPG
jgi:hypothetical protein